MLDLLDWNGLGNWDAAKLLITCLKNREEFNSSTFLRDKLAKGISASSTRRSRAKAVLLEVQRVALHECADNKIYFHHKYVPSRVDKKEREEYFNRVGDLVKTWANTAKNQWYSTYKSKKSIPDIDKKYNDKKNRQRMTVTALGGFLEELRSLP